MTKKVKKQTNQNTNAGKKGNMVYYNVIAFFSILIISIVVFSGSITKIFIALDDQAYISDNPFIKSLSWENIKNIFSTFYNANYHPLTTLLYAIEFKLFGNDASMYHIISLSIHIINSFFVFHLIDKLIGKKWFAIFGSLIFAVHPMHVESVVWISEQKDVLYSLFYFGGLIVYIKYLKDKKIKKLFFVFILFFLSLLSKSAAVTFPMILLLFDYYFKREQNIKTKIEKIPFFVLALIFGIVSIFSQSAAGAINDSTMVPYSLFQRVFVVSYAILYYIFKFIVPFDLCVLHYAPKDLPFYYYLCPFIIFLICFIIWKSKEIRKSLIFGFLFYLFTILLVVQIIPVGYVIVSERYSYIPYLGLICIIGFIFIQNNKIENPVILSVRKYFKLISILIILIFSFLSFQYIKKWQSSTSLFTDIVQKNPQSAFGFNALGKVQSASGDSSNAINSFSTAIRLDSTIIEAYFCRGNIYFAKKMYGDARKDYLKTELLKPNYRDNLNNLAFLYSETGKMDDAILYYSKAISINPTIYLYQRRATCYTYLKKYAEALEDYNRTIKINPFLNEPYFNRGVCYFYVNQLEKACADWEKASSMGYKNANDLISKFCK